MRASKAFHSPFLLARVAQNSEDKSRFSCVVSKKIDKRAVKRNLLRRNMYNVLGEIGPEIKQNCIALIFAKKGCESLEYKELKDEVRLMLGRAGLLAH